MDKLIGSFEAKTKFSHVISEVVDNNTNYIITRRGKPVAIIKPYLEDEVNHKKEVIDDFMEYRDSKNLELHRNGSIFDIIHDKHKYYESSDN